jgi:hypothetical protein
LCYVWMGRPLIVLCVRRVVHYKDIVPHLPPRTPGGFWHVMTEIWEQVELFTHDTQSIPPCCRCSVIHSLILTLFEGRAGEAASYITCLDGDGEDPSCSDSVSLFIHLHLFRGASRSRACSRLCSCSAPGPHPGTNQRPAAFASRDM